MCFADNIALEPLANAFVSGISKEWQDAQMYNYIHRNDEGFENSLMYKRNMRIIKDVEMFLLGEGFTWFYPIDGIGIRRKLNRELDDWKRKYDRKIKENKNA